MKLELIDQGCCEHLPSQVTLTGGEVSMIADILTNLPMCRGRRTYICEYGNTHEVSFSMQDKRQEHWHDLSPAAENYRKFQESRPERG